MEHSAEVVNVDYKKKIKINGIEARSIIFAENYPREYKTWVDTTFLSITRSGLNGRPGYSGEHAKELSMQPQRAYSTGESYGQTKNTSWGQRSGPLTVTAEPTYFWQVQQARGNLSHSMAWSITHYAGVQEQCMRMAKQTSAYLLLSGLCADVWVGMTTSCISIC